MGVAAPRVRPAVLCVPPAFAQVRSERLGFADLSEHMAREGGDAHDCCTRHHRRKRLPELVADVKDHLHLNGPWQYQLSDLYDEPAVTTAVEKITAEKDAMAAA